MTYLEERQVNDQKEKNEIGFSTYYSEVNVLYFLFSIQFTLCYANVLLFFDINT